MPPIATLLYVASVSPSWNDITYVSHMFFVRLPHADRTLFRHCRKWVVSSARPAPRAPPLCSTPPPCLSSILHAVRPSQRMRRQPPPFFPCAFATRATTQIYGKPSPCPPSSPTSHLPLNVNAITGKTCLSTPFPHSPPSPPPPDPLLPNDLRSYPLRVRSDICKATDGGSRMLKPSPIPDYMKRVPGRKAPYEIALEEEEAAIRRACANPVIRSSGTCFSQRRGVSAHDPPGVCRGSQY
jgi:hypothetical protein